MGLKVKEIIEENIIEEYGQFSSRVSTINKVIDIKNYPNRRAKRSKRLKRK